MLNILFYTCYIFSIIYITDLNFLYIFIILPDIYLYKFYLYNWRL